MDALVRYLGPRLHGKAEVDRSLARFTTYRLGGPAALYVEIADRHDLDVLGDALDRFAASSEGTPLIVVGRGSNLVVSDQGFPGIVVRMGESFATIVVDAEEDSWIIAGAAAPLPTVANFAARRGLSGVEFLVSIPGSIGGAVRMNAGAHGSEISERVSSVRLFDLDRLTLEDRKAGSLGFRYRSSDVTERHLVVDVTLGLSKQPSEEIRERMREFRRHREQTQPGALQNAGSVFKNPPGDSAGRLIETAGLKGHRIGGASVSELHANFFIADNTARAQDVFDLVHYVRSQVKERFAVDLEPEIRFVGAFRESAARVAGGDPS